MNELELLTCQRTAFRTFRQAMIETTRREEKAFERLEAVAAKAIDDARIGKSRAQKWLKETDKALWKGRKALGRLYLAHTMLDKEMIVPQLDGSADFGDELERSVAMAHVALAAVERNVQALQQRRRARARRRRVRRNVAAIVVSLVVLIIIVGCAVLLGQLLGQ